MPSVPVLFTIGRQDFFNAPEFQRRLKLFNNLLHQRLEQRPLSVIAPSEFALTAANKTKSQWNNQERTSSPLSSTIFSNFNEGPFGFFWPCPHFCTVKELVFK